MTTVITKAEERQLLKKIRGLWRYRKTNDLLAFIAKFGISLDQLRRMSRREIRNFCELAEQSEEPPRRDLAKLGIAVVEKLYNPVRFLMTNYGDEDVEWQPIRRGSR